MRMVSDLTLAEQNQELHELRAALHGMVEVASRERLLVGRAVFTAREQPAPVRMLPRQVAFYGGQSTVGMPFYIQDFVVTTAGGMSVYVRGQLSKTDVHHLLLYGTNREEDSVLEIRNVPVTDVQQHCLELVRLAGDRLNNLAVPLDWQRTLGHDLRWSRIVCSENAA